MLIKQIIEFELKGPGPSGRTCTSITAYFHDKTKISKENLREWTITANFIIRCKHSPNAYILQIFGSACFLDSDSSVHYSKLHLG